MKKAIFWALFGILITSQTAHAQRAFGVHGWGPRAGVSIDPDQIHLGAHLDLGDLAEHLVLLPNIEVGMGDNATILTAMFEVDYRFQENWGSWRPYVGGGIGPVFLWVNDFSSTEFGLTIQGGITRRLKGRPGLFFIELKLGLSDAPDMKFSVGWLFAKKSK